MQHASAREATTRVSRPALLLVLFALAAGSIGVSHAADSRPSVVLIVIDDFGAEGLGSYGGRSYDTPHIDSLARKGIRFANAYTPPACTPTRVQLMSGQYPFRTGWDRGIWIEEPGDQHVSPRILRLGTTMQNAGYRTAVVGKWQLARFDQDPDHPGASGFGTFTLWGWITGNRRHARYRNPGIWSDGSWMETDRTDYGPNIHANSAVEFIESAAPEPFFLYYPMVLVHGPPHAPPVNRAVAEDEQFTAMVEYADRLVGRIVRSLESLGIRDDTLVLVTADNGMPESVSSRLNGRAVAGGKGTMTEAGTRVPLIASWPDTIRPGLVSETPVETVDILPTIAAATSAPVSPAAPLDGESLLPQFRGNQLDRSDSAYVQWQDDWFIRSREFRLHSDGRLYEMRSDRYDAGSPVPLGWSNLLVWTRLRVMALAARDQVFFAGLIGACALALLSAIAYWRLRARAARSTSGN